MTDETTPCRHEYTTIVRKMGPEHVESKRVCQVCGADLPEDWPVDARPMTDGDTARYVALAQSLLGALRTMQGATLEIRDLDDDRFDVDVSGVYYTTPECQQHMADLAARINDAPR